MHLDKLLSRARSDIYFNEHMDVDGALMFKHACKMGLEGIFSKRRDAPYRAGRSKSWLKIENPKSPAMMRVEEGHSEPDEAIECRPPPSGSLTVFAAFALLWQFTR